MSLDRKAFLDFVDDRLGTVDIPEMGGVVRLAKLSVAEANRIAALGKDDMPAAVGIVILCACDDKGARLFTDEDAPELARKPGDIIGRIARAAMDHNGLGEEAGEEAKNVSGGTPDGASASD